MISDNAAYPEVTSIYDQGRQWSRILTCFPMVREQETRCAETLQRGWENFDNARKLHDPITVSAMPNRSTVSTELGRMGFFRECSEMYRAASQFLSSIKLQEGGSQHVGPTVISQRSHQSTDAVQLKKDLLDSVFQNIEEAMAGCRSSVIRVPDLARTPDRKLNSLETELRPLKSYVKTLQARESSSPECRVRPLPNDSHLAPLPTSISGLEGDDLWSAILADIPLSPAQRASCTSYLQRGWENLALAEKIYTFDPENIATPSLPGRDVSTDLDREGYFQECGELSHAVEELSSFIDAQEARYEDGEPKRAWAESGYSLTQARLFLGRVASSVENVREECRSLDIHIHDWGSDTESKLERLEKEVQKLRQCVRNFQDDTEL